MKRRKPLIKTPTSGSEMSNAPRWKVRQQLSDAALGIMLTSTGLFAGRYVWHEAPLRPPIPPEVSATTMSEVFDLLEGIEIQCSVPIRIERLRKGVGAQCGAPDFEVLLTSDEASASEAYSVVRSLLCTQAASAGTLQWFLFTFEHWSLLTFDSNVADSVGQFATARATAADCGWEQISIRA